ncbi:hypothetical protein SRABI112_01316 [Pseudomonas mediterranea]|nr:hypothetical protein SRABI112_01316 [Pseudomonas mediterranea]
MGLGQRRLGLADFEMSADATVETLLRQVENLFLLAQGRGDDIALGIMQCKADIGLHDVVLQLQLCLPCLGDAGMGQVDCPLAGVALPPPQVQGVAQAQAGVVVPGGRIGQFARTVELIGGPVVALESGLAIDLRRLGRLGNTGHGLGLSHPGDGQGQARAVLHRQVDPAIQLRVAITLPPLATGPVGIAGGLADRFIGGQSVG